MQLTKRNCSNGCGRLAENGSHCTNCRKQNDQRRPFPVERGYDKYHGKLRILCFIRDGWKCVDCGWEPDVVRDCRQYGIDDPPITIILDELRARWNANQRHLHADHDLPIDERPDLRLELDNYRTRCNSAMQLRP